MYLMKDIVRDPAPVLRTQAQKVTFPLGEDDQKAMKEMMEYLVVSQDEEQNKIYDLRPGVGLAAPQVGISKQFSAILIPGEDVEPWDDEEKDDAEIPPFFKGIIINPVIVRQSVKKGALRVGEGCLSVDQDVPGYVNRSYRITVKYQDEMGAFHELKLEGYPAIVFQHEIDHLHGVLYYDHIQDDPWVETDNTKYLG